MGLPSSLSSLSSLSSGFLTPFVKWLWNESHTTKEWHFWSPPMVDQTVANQSFTKASLIHPFSCNLIMATSRKFSPFGNVFCLNTTYRGSLLPVPFMASWREGNKFYRCLISITYLSLRLELNFSHILITNCWKDTVFSPFLGEMLGNSCSPLDGQTMPCHKLKYQHSRIPLFSDQCCESLLQFRVKCSSPT